MVKLYQEETELSWGKLIWNKWIINILFFFTGFSALRPHPQARLGGHERSVRDSFFFILIRITPPHVAIRVASHGIASIIPKTKMGFGLQRPIYNKTIASLIIWNTRSRGVLFMFLLYESISTVASLSLGG